MFVGRRDSEGFSAPCECGSSLCNASGYVLGFVGLPWPGIAGPAHPHISNQTAAESLCLIPCSRYSLLFHERTCSGGA